VDRTTGVEPFHAGAVGVVLTPRPNLPKAGRANQ
jgi:hypothetical protein